MKTFFSILCILMLLGCAQKHHLRYNPDLEERRLEPINLRTMIRIAPIMVEGYTTDAPFLTFLTGHYFPTLKEDIKDVIRKDLRYDLFPLEGDSAEILVNVRTRFDFYVEPVPYKFLVNPLIIIGGTITGAFLIGYYLEPFGEPVESGMGPDIPGTCNMCLGGTTGCLAGGIVNISLDKALSDTWVFCDILDRNAAIIASYTAKVIKKKNKNFFSAGKNPDEHQVLQASLSEALSDIKSQIDKDREKILEAVKE
jgi:hypothetical protein